MSRPEERFGGVNLLEVLAFLHRRAEYGNRPVLKCRSNGMERRVCRQKRGAAEAKVRLASTSSTFR